MDPLKSYTPDTDVLINSFLGPAGPDRAAWMAAEAAWKRTPSEAAAAARAENPREFEPEWQWLSGVHVRQHVRACWKAAQALSRGNKKATDARRAEAARATAEIERWQQRATFDA